MVVMLLLCVSGIVYIIQPQPTALAAADPMRQAIEESLPAIRRVLEQQGLAERLTIGRRPDHSIIITGWLHDAAEQEQVATAMARVWPMPALRLSNEADLRATALSVLQAYPIRYDARYQGDGVLAIRASRRTPSSAPVPATCCARRCRASGWTWARCCWPTKSASGWRPPPRRPACPSRRRNGTARGWRSRRRTSPSRPAAWRA